MDDLLEFFDQITMAMQDELYETHSESYSREHSIWASLSADMLQSPLREREAAMSAVIERTVLILVHDDKKRSLREQTKTSKLELLKDLNWCLMHRRLYSS